MQKLFDLSRISIAVIGLGYVGLPLAMAFARTYPGRVRAFDINSKRIEALQRGEDNTRTFTKKELLSPDLQYTASPEDIRGMDFYVVAVPTPLGRAHHPDLRAVKSASEIVGKIIGKGSIVCFESTVYPGVTRDICGPVIEKTSGLKSGVDFFLGYSPERINPGDTVHRLENIIKVVGGQTPEVCEQVAQIYSLVIEAGVYPVSSIEVAEATKVIENTQRDVNIALMNELAQIFDHFGLATAEILEAASTKWNFLPFKPGLVGGHCIGIDPYYLTYCAEQAGYYPELILAGRKINDGMGKFIAEKVVRHVCRKGLTPQKAKTGILGVTFKENVPDVRNSKVPDIIRCLRDYDMEVAVHDPLCDPLEFREEFHIDLNRESELYDCDVVILAVTHEHYVRHGVDGCVKRLRDRQGFLIDVKAVFMRQGVPEGVTYWSL